MTFKDLVFAPRQFGGIGCHTEINGFILSVQASAFNYCDPRVDMDSEKDYKTFEVAIWEAAEPRTWVTNRFLDVNNDVCGHMTRDEINDLIKRIEFRQFIN